MVFLIFFIIIAVLILSHEFGHFLAAKLTNTKVEEFGFGFPPKIFWRKRGETIYSFNLFPIGGFVKILGEDGQSDVKHSVLDAEESRNFSFKSAGVQALIVSAGVLFNLILAWILISISLSLGSFQQIDDNFAEENIKPQVIIVEVQKGSPAESAGLLPGDILIGYRIAELSGYAMAEPTKMSEVQNFINSNRGKKIEITYKRGDVLFSSSAQLKDAKAEEGALGIAMARVAVIQEPWYAAIFKGLKQTAFLVFAVSAGIFYFIIGLFQGVGFEQVAGPVGIFNIVGKTAQFGLSHLIQLTALLSINLAIINFFPFPALDGGRLIVVLVEKIKGSPINYKVINLIHSVGFALLIFLMFLVTYQDILRLI